MKEIELDPASAEINRINSTQAEEFRLNVSVAEPQPRPSGDQSLSGHVWFCSVEKNFEQFWHLTIIIYSHMYNITGGETEKQETALKYKEPFSA